MKFQFVVLLGLVLAVSAIPVVDEAQLKLEKGVRDFFENFLTQVLLPPVITAVQDSAALLAQVTAGVHEGGLDAILGLFGKRDVEISPKALDELRELWNTLYQSIREGAYGVANQIAQQLGLSLTQILQQISQGKRSVSDVVSEAAENVQGLVFTLNWFANILLNSIRESIGLNPQSKILGELGNLFESLVQTIRDNAYEAANQLAQQLGLSATQILQQLSQGKRDAEGKDDVLQWALNILGSNAREILSALGQEALNNLSNLNLPQLIAFLTQLGKRDVEGKYEDNLNWTFTGSNGVEALTNLVQQALQELSNMSLPDILTYLGQLGKRDAEGKDDTLQWALNILGSNAQELLSGLGQELLQNLGQINWPQLLVLLGKRDAEAEGKFIQVLSSWISNFINTYGSQIQDHLGNLVNQVLAPALHLSVQQASALLSQITAAVAVDGLPALQSILGSLLGSIGK